MQVPAAVLGLGEPRHGEDAMILGQGSVPLTGSTLTAYAPMPLSRAQALPAQKAIASRVGAGSHSPSPAGWPRPR